MRILNYLKSFWNADIIRIKIAYYKSVEFFENFEYFRLRSILIN